MSRGASIVRVPLSEPSISEGDIAAVVEVFLAEVAGLGVRPRSAAATFDADGGGWQVEIDVPVTVELREALIADVRAYLTDLRVPCLVLGREAGTGE